MKKLLYSLAVVLASVTGLTGCTTFDDEHSEKYGDGPAVAINLVETKDNSFTVTVNPADGTNYYAYAVVEGDEAEDVDANAVFKKTLGGISEAIVKYSTAASTTIDMLNSKGQGICQPNTSYVVYAVAANDKGMLGNVQTLVVKTTDGDAPTIGDYEAGEPSEQTTVTFSEPVYAGQGTVSAQYYQEWGDGNLVDIPASDVHYTINGANVTFTVDNVPAGAYVLYSWTEGTFTDSFGNKCPAENTVIDPEQGIVGVYNRMPLKPFGITAKQFSPESGSTIGQYTDFHGTITFPFDVYRNDIEESDDCVKTGDISVVYTNAKKTTTVGLDPADWAVSGKTVTFKLPEAPAVGDIVTLKIKAGVIMDINGNGNNAFNSENLSWKYAGFIATKSMVLGNFNLNYYSTKQKKQGVNAVNIVEAPEGNEDKVDVYINGLLTAEGQGGATLDLANNKLYMQPGFMVGAYDSNGTTVYVLTYSASQADEIECTINSDGTISTDDLAFVTYVQGTGITGWYDIWKPAKFVKTTAAARAKTRAARVRTTPKKFNIKGMKAPARKKLSQVNK